MDRDQLTRTFVLSEISDDYENVEHIHEQIVELGHRCGMRISPDEIVRALAGLIDAGLARAYRLSPTRPTEEIQGVPALDEFEDLYFWITKSGRELQTAYPASWPFDDDGSLRKNWSPLPV